MSNKNQKGTNVQSTNVSQNSISENLKAKFANYNLKEKEESISNRNVKEQIYVYPNEAKLKDMFGSHDNSILQKKFRTKVRNQIQRSMDEILLIGIRFAKGTIKESEFKNELVSPIEKFNELYKANFKVNNYELNSFSQSNNGTKRIDYQNALDIIKEFKSENK